MFPKEHAGAFLGIPNPVQLDILSMSRRGAVSTKGSAEVNAILVCPYLAHTPTNLFLRESSNSTASPFFPLPLFIKLLYHPCLDSWSH